MNSAKETISIPRTDNANPDNESEWIDNITDIDLLRATIKDKLRKIETINKQLGEFVYIVSHDLKAPLRGLTSLTVFLEEEIGENATPQAKELLGMIRVRSARMQNLIDAILHYSRIANTKTEKQQMNIKNLLLSIIDFISVPPSIKVEMQDNLPIICGEKIKLHEVFQNLLSNAIKYNSKENGIIKISFQDAGDKVQFTIEDNGIGIKKEYFEKIFGMFQTLQPKDKSTNTGVGLTIVKKLVEDGGGKIWLESEEGQGTKFHFTWSKA